MERLSRRSHAIGLRWALVSFVGLSFAAACSSDDDSSSEPTAGSGGQSGATTGGKGSTAGTNSAGTNAKAGSGGSVGMTGGTGTGGASGGEAGAGGEPPTPGQVCTACAATECAPKVTSCSGTPECAVWLGCISACDTPDCAATCDDKYPDAARLYAGVYDCLCTSCTDECASANVCAKKTCVDDSPLPNETVAPATLADTGLYATLDGAGGDGAGGGGGGGAGSVDLAMPIAIAPYVKTFAPKYPLWADGAKKDRYVYIPKCATIDNTDPDHWKFPVGTRFWKTFTVDNKVVETRTMHRFGEGALDWTYATYQWDVNKPADPASALLVSDVGVPNANGTTHDIPSLGQCKTCHNGLPEKILGFGSIQLSHDSAGVDLTLKKISDLGWLTKAAPAGGYLVPGTPVQQAALGYMHGNCGGCHNDSTPTPASKPQILRLSVGQTMYATTDAVTTTVGVVVVSGNAAITGKNRITLNDPQNSAILIRMMSRVAGVQMPPLGTKLADTDGGVKVVTDWIGPKP
jgi:hypothetical protein